MSSYSDDPEIEPSSDCGREEPTPDQLIQAYIEYSNESRYRDGLMHNSYYFVLIGVVLFTGHILSLTSADFTLSSPRLGIAVFAGGGVAIGIGVVMKTYNRKKINAEHQRQVLENVLDGYFTEKGIMATHENQNYRPRNEDNPFAIQATVIGRNSGVAEGFFIDTLPITLMASIVIWSGIISVILGAWILSSSF